MTDHVVRLYALALAVLVFFTAWAVVAARPWGAPAAEPSPALVELRAREERLARRQARVQRAVERRFAVYRQKLAERRRLEAELDAAATGVAVSAPAASPAPAAPAPVQVTSLPPVTSSESS